VSNQGPRRSRFSGLLASAEVLSVTVHENVALVQLAGLKMKSALPSSPHQRGVGVGGSEVDESSVRPRRIPADWLVSWLPPVLAWLISATVMVVTSIVDGWPPFAATRTWTRWDSNLYLQVAKGGYNLFRCTRPFGKPGQWCGNSGWFPGYPWILAALHWLSFPLAPAALALSWLLFLAALLVLWRAFLVHQPWPAAAIALTFAAFTPGLPYEYGVFPLSLLSLCTIAFFAFLQRGYWLAAGAAAAAGALAYPVGVIAAPVAAVWLLADRGIPFSQRARRVCAVAGPTVAALALFLFVEQIETGHWNAYLLTQAKYGHRLVDPAVNLVRAFHQAAHTPLGLAGAPALQTLFITFVLICAAVAVAIRRGPNTRFDVLIVIWAVAVWLELYAQTNLDSYRGVAGLLVLAVLLPRLPRLLASGIAVAAILIVVPMATLYFRGVLV
jgi:hypothetical protein